MRGMLGDQDVPGGGGGGAVPGVNPAVSGLPGGAGGGAVPGVNPAVSGLPGWRGWRFGAGGVIRR